MKSSIAKQLPVEIPTTLLYFKLKYNIISPRNVHAVIERNKQSAQAAAGSVYILVNCAIPTPRSIVGEANESKIAPHSVSKERFEKLINKEYIQI